MLKGGSDRPVLIQAFCVTQVALSLGLMPFVEIPAAAAWPYLIGSSLISTACWLLFNRAYETGDLSLVYPLARGGAPLVAALLSLLFLDEQLTRAGLIGVLLIGLGIISLTLARGADGLRDRRAIGLALVLGVLIGGYTILDGLGARAAGSSGSYYVWVALIASLQGFAAVSWLHPLRGTLERRALGQGVLSGCIAYICSWIVIWAFTQAPIALVSALRETGVVFAVIIGVVVLKERLSLARLASIATTLVGTAILKVTR